jgi:thiol-disulfide isomerase/thioredoxin
MIDVLKTLQAKADTAAALRNFERIWRDAPPDRHDQVLQYATRLAVNSGDTVALRRWTDRMLTSSLESGQRSPRGPVTRSVALDFARVPALRHEGLQRLRNELARVSTARPSTRSLDETQMEYNARQQRGIRNTMAALGEALALDGQHRAALDTLQRAVHDAWDVVVTRTLRKEALTAGDTGIALRATARLSVDPRTSADRRTEYETFGAATLGAARWQAALDSARRDFVRHTFAKMRPRAINTAIPLQTLDGKPADLRRALMGQVTVVAFLSRFCGPAIEVIPELQQLASDVKLHGVRTLMVYEERVPSAAFSEFLRQHKVTLPVMLDDTQSASATFNQWGTPYFYVVDARGRIMSEPTSDTDELRVSIEAVRLAAALR